jgi:N-acetyl sugar amidotransferase
MSDGGEATPQECIRCVFNTSVVPDLTFDRHGTCSMCLRYDRESSIRVKTGAEGRQLLADRVAQIQRRGASRPYDCIIGVSGGTDSTYVALLTKELGLRALAVHLDNGWDSELAVANIERTLSTLGIDLETEVLNWPEFRDLQLAFLRSSTPDGEIPTDHAIQAVLWRTAARYGVSTVISGMNFATESTSFPQQWAYGHADWRYIKDVHRRYGSVPLSSYPHFTLGYLGYVSVVRRVRTLSVLNYVDYDKAAAQQVIASDLGWRDYGGKHHESIYTRFFQGYVLPRKFGIDKRYAHVCDLVRSGKLSREDALAELARPPYDPAVQEQDRRYVLKKLRLSDAEFSAIMDAPPRTYHDFQNNYHRVARLKGLVGRLRTRGLYDL